MVGNCECKQGHPVRVVVSVGLVALALFLAVCVVVFERVAPRIENGLGITPVEQIQQPGGISYDTLKNAPLNQLPVNEQANREVKKQTGANPSPTPANPNTKVDVTSVPTSRRCSVALFVGTDAQSTALLDWFNRDADCVRLRANVNFQTYTKDNPLYRERYASVIPVDQFPAIVFSDELGGHIYVAGRSTLPPTASQLLGDMKTALDTQRKAREQSVDQVETIEGTDPNCPDGSCRPADREPFLNPERLPLFPNLRPDRQPAPESLLYWLMNPGEAVLALGCAGMFAMLCLLVLIKVVRS